MRNFRIFSSYFGFLPLLEKFNVIFYKQYGYFTVLAAIIRENSNKQSRIERNGEGFALLSST